MIASVPCNCLSFTFSHPLFGNKHAIVISVYASTMTNLDEMNDKLYAGRIICTSLKDKAILLVDFNSRVGTALNMIY